MQTLMVKTLKIMKQNKLASPLWLPALSRSLERRYWACLPREMCGVIRQLQDGAFCFTQFENRTETSPATSFQIAPIEVLRCCQQSMQEGSELCAWIHSHPSGLARASEADTTFWWADRTWLWPGMDQVIMWPNGSKNLNLSVYGPQTDPSTLIPRWQGPLNHLNRRITVDRSGAIEHTVC